ncbi:MAG TPA: Ig-like domain-containing protein, partial [Gemmatimonadaceae bacterium]
MNSTKKSRAAGSLRSFAFVCVSVAALIVAACEGGSVTGPGETPVPTPELPNGPVLTINAFVCSASPKQLSVICEPAPDPMSPLPSYSQGIEWGNTAEPSKILIGGQHKNVDVTSTNIAIVADSFTFDVTVKNLRPQPIGTVDGITTDSSLAVFFHSGPTTTGGTGSVAVANPDGTGAFTAAGQPFFKYPQMLAQNQTSTAKKWKLRFDPGVNTFSFLLLISANVKHPDGYIDVFSSADSVAIGATLQMEDSVRDALGVATADQSETWQLSDSSKASIDAAGLLTGLAAGNVTVTATQGDKTGSKLITVKQPASAPDAKNDAFTAQVAVNLNGDVTVDNGSGADNLGAPAATLASFGGGSLGGTVTSNAAGQSVSLAGGTLTVNANGTLSLTSPTTGGVYTFQYRLTNSQGSDDATVTISVNRAPDAVDDALTADVAVTLNANLVLNDDRGAPAATVASFGGGSPGGTVTTNAAGASVALAGGTLTVNADGSVSLANATTSGTYTFQYRLTNPVGSDDATATIVVRRPPDAKNDAFTTTSPATLNGNVTSDNGSGADDLGDPAATVTGFGGGSLSGNTTTNAAGASVALAGGTLTVNANGTVSLANPAMGGVYTFRYRLANTAGSDSATVTINVNAAPIAVVDSAASNSAPGSNWHTAFNTTLSSPSVTANDNLGIPQATVATFGGGTLGGTVTSNAAGATVAVDGHSFTLNANGSFTYTPKTGFTGYFTTNYRITNAGGSSDALIKIAVGVRPSASNSTYGTTLPGNVGINTSTSTSTKVSAAGDGLTYNNVSATNGTGSVHADGTYDFKPSAGFASGNGTLVFTVTNGFGTTSNATVTIPVGAGRIWFVASGGTGDGRYGTPFGCIVGASGCLSNQSLNSNDIVHVGSGTYSNTANLNLTAGMRIIGAGATGAFSAASNANVTWPADAGAQPTTGAARPRIDTQSSIGVFVLATGNYLRGLIAGSSPGGSSISGSAVGTFTMSDAAIVNPGGGAISLTTSGTLAVTVDSIVASGTTGINLVNQGGTFTSALTKISGSTSTGINVTGSAGFSFGTTFVKKTSAGTAINLATNTGTTSFSSLVDSTTSGAALVASSAGTVNI